MVADLIQANLADSPRRARSARKARGGVVLRAADRDLAVTVHFAGDEVVVSGDADPTVVTILSGTWLDMAEVCSGQRSPLGAVVRKRLKVARGGRARLLARAAFVLKAPSAAFGGVRSSRRGSSRKAAMEGRR